MESARDQRRADDTKSGGHKRTETTDTPGHQLTPIDHTEAALPDTAGELADVSGWVTTDVAAAALGVSPRTVRRLIDRGELVARIEEEGIYKAWEVSIDSLQALRDRRKSEGRDRRESPDMSAMTEGIADVVERLSARLAQEAAVAAEMRARYELTEKAESSLREDLEREREERRQAQDEAGKLREELTAERSKGFFRRLFGSR